MPPSPGPVSGSTPPRPDLPAPGSGYGSDPGWTQPIPRRRGRRLTAFFAVLALTVASLGGGLAVIERLTRPTSDPSQHAFLLERLDGTPVRWNACDAIRYVVNPSTAPEGSIADVHEAVRRVSAATGIAFEYEGLTDEIPERRRPAYQPDRYGDRWAPVLIAWVDPDQTNIPFDRSGHTAAAVASPTVPSGRDQVFVSGWIAMNLRDENPPGFGFAGAQGPVLLHELGHVMGLGHVDRMGEIMEPSGGNVADFGPGDLEGLNQVGRRAGCLTVPSPTP
jgi:hypothetical protein